MRSLMQTQKKILTPFWCINPTLHNPINYKMAKIKLRLTVVTMKNLNIRNIFIFIYQV